MACRGIFGVCNYIIGILFPTLYLYRILVVVGVGTENLNETLTIRKLKLIQPTKPWILQK